MIYESPMTFLQQFVSQHVVERAVPAHMPLFRATVVYFLYTSSSEISTDVLQIRDVNISKVALPMSNVRPYVPLVAPCPVHSPRSRHQSSR